MITDLLAQLPEPDWDKAFEDQPVFYWKTVLPQLAERDFIMVWPPGVRKIEGEKNYFAVLEQMKADYNIDPDGLYLIGVSGGGLSSWCIGLRYPHLIAAIAPISGVVQASGKVEMGPGGGDGTDNIDPARSALYFPMNALHVPAIILHGDSDPVTPHTTQALPMVEKMKELGLDYEYHEYPGADHGLGEAGYPDAFRRALDFFEKHPNIAHPKTIDYSTWNLRYNRAYWLRIDAFETEGERAWIQAKAEGNSVEIKTENVKAWTLLPDTEVFDLSQPIEIQLNGAEPVSERPAQDGGIAFGSSAETPRTAAPSTPKPSRQTR
jgi:pimeloyl-ACP methyl ester carboxylesterase